MPITFQHTVRADYMFTMILSVILCLAVHAQQQPANVTLENELLRLSFSGDIHQYTIQDKRTQRLWESPALASSFEVLELTQTRDSELWLRFRARANGASYGTRVTLLEDSVSFAVDADEPSKPIRELSYPAIPTASLPNQRLIFCNRASGISLPVATTNYPHKRLTCYANTGALDIPLFGVLDGQENEGVMLIIETPTEAAIDIEPNANGIIEPRFLWFDSFGGLSYTRKVTFQFIDEGGYVSMAQRYRAWAEDAGQMKTLAAKAEERERVNWLKGAAVVWGDIGESIVYEGPVHGIRRMMLNGRFTPETIEHVRDIGYLLGEYDNYSDITDGKLGSSKDNVEEVGLRGKDGELILGWLTKEGTQYYNRSSRFAKRAAEAVIPPLLDEYAYTARFLDVLSSLQFFEDHHPTRPMDRRQDMKFRQELYAYIGSQGLVTGGEHTKAWCVPYCDYTEGNLSGSYWWLSDVGHLVPLEDRSDIPQPYWDFGMDQTLRVPLWELVFHDNIVSTWYWGDSNGYLYNIAPELSDVKDTINVLYGTMPVVWLDHLGYGWYRNRDRLLETVYTTTPLHERIGFDAMTGHEFLSPNRLVQRTEFSSGAVVYANFDQQVQTVTLDSGKTVQLPQNGYYVALDGHVHQKTWHADAMEVHVQSEDFFYASTDAPSPRNIGPATLTGELAAYPTNDGAWNLRYRSSQPVVLDLQRLGALATDTEFRAVYIDDRGHFRAPFEEEPNVSLRLPPVEESTLITLLPGVDPATPLIIPNGGRITTEDLVELSSDANDVTLRYTLDGSAPEAVSTAYEGPIRLQSGALIRAAAFRGDAQVGAESTAEIAVEIPLFTSPVVRGTDAAVAVDIPVEGLSELHIQITDAGDGLHYDQAALGNAHFTRNDSGKVSLTEYAPLSAVRFSLAGGKNQYEGDPISIGGQKFDVGICSHAMDHIVYKISSDFTHFKAQVGVHDRTTREGPKGKKNGSLQFIFTGVSKPEKEGGTAETSDNS